MTFLLAMLAWTLAAALLAPLVGRAIARNNGRWVESPVVIPAVARRVERRRTPRRH